MFSSYSVGLICLVSVLQFGQSLHSFDNFKTLDVTIDFCRRTEPWVKEAEQLGILILILIIAKKIKGLKV